MDTVYPVVSTSRRVDVDHGSGENTSGAPAPPSPGQTTPSATKGSTFVGTDAAASSGLPPQLFPRNSRVAITGVSAPFGSPEVKAGLTVTPETADIEVLPESPEISPELAEHVERVIRGEVQLPGPIEIGTHEGRPVTLEPAAPQQPNIVLPLTRDDFTAGQSQPISSSFRWLYEFVKRIILMFPGRAVYRAG